MNGRRAIAWAHNTMLIVSSDFSFYGALTKTICCAVIQSTYAIILVTAKINDATVHRCIDSYIGTS